MEVGSKVFSKLHIDKGIGTIVNIEKLFDERYMDVLFTKVLQWQEELRLKFNENFVVYNRELIKSLVGTYGEHSNIWKLNNKIIASIDTIKPYKIHDDLTEKQKRKRQWHNKYVYNDLIDADFDLLILDEAHKLTKEYGGSETARYKLGKLLTDSIPMNLLLTATPHQGDEYTFLHLLQLLNPITFNTVDSLTPENVKEITVRNKKRAVVDFKGNRIFKHRITSLIEIHRTEEDNLDELNLYNVITDYTKEYYDMASKSNNQIIILLTILYQRICSSSSFAVESTLSKRKNLLNYYLNNTKTSSKSEDYDSIEEIEKIITHNPIWTN